MDFTGTSTRLVENVANHSRVKQMLAIFACNFYREGIDMYLHESKS